MKEKKEKEREGKVAEKIKEDGSEAERGENGRKEEEG